MTVRVGVYICECGPNIRDALDLERLRQHIGGLSAVSGVHVVPLLCAAEGMASIGRDIQIHHYSHVVFAACSPKEHEPTFRQIMEAAGLNPFLMQVANIREHCAWVDRNPASATQKAETIIQAAVARVQHHRPLTISHFPCCTDALVVGAGVAGMSAALTLARSGRTVYLVEKQPCIGGKVALFESLAPDLGCAACELDPMMDAVLHHPDIRLYTQSRIQSIAGSMGCFTIRIRQKPRFVDADACIGCGACFDVCPVSVENRFNYAMDQCKAIAIPYPGALPHVAAIDETSCRHMADGSCDACRQACPFDAIRLDDRETEIERTVGAVILASGFDLFDPELSSRYGYGRIQNVVTSMEFERMLNTDGPTEGEIRDSDGIPPRRIGLIHCVGSRCPEFHSHCSRICCSYLLKYARQITEKLPDAKLHLLDAELCLPGRKAQSLFQEAADNPRLARCRLKHPGSVQINGATDGIAIDYTSYDNRPGSVNVDMVVLAPAMIGAADAGQLAEILHIDMDEHGFFKASEDLFAPVRTTRDGILVAGCAGGPADVGTSVARGQATAAMVMQDLIPGKKLPVEPMAAVVNGDICAGCGQCIDACAAHAITPAEDGIGVTVDPLLCRGCGVCAAVCPCGALTAGHFCTDQISAEIGGLLDDRS